MLENIPTEVTEGCKDCAKNRNLLKKYEKLTHLYQKKQLKLTNNGSSYISNGKTTNNTSDVASAYVNCIRMTDALSGLVKKRWQLLFRFPTQQSAKKLVLYSICNRLAKSSKAKAFGKIKLHQVADCEPILQQKNQILLDQILKRKNSSGLSVIQQLMTQKADDFTKNTFQYLAQLKEICKETNANDKSLHRENLLLLLKNKKLTLQNKALRECVQELDKRLAKENQKKRETLQQLADEINEKNEEIAQLRQSLKAYENTHNAGEKVLEDDYVSLKKDVDQLQRLNERLNNDLGKVKDQLLETTKKLKISEEKNEILQKQCTRSHKQIHELTLKASRAQQMSHESSKLIKSIQKKLKRLAVYQKYLEQNSVNTQNPLKGNTVTISQQLKSQFILMFLANISDADYCLKSEHLFDEDQKSLLLSHKENWIKYENQIQAKGNRNHHQAKIDCLEISEIDAKGIQMESMMNALENSRNYQCREREGPTMRMLELELENNRQVGKVTELKEKFLHTRFIILKLLKSLELSNELKAETRDILRVIFDLFEYSEEQRNSVFVKKKKIFGFI